MIFFTDYERVKRRTGERERGERITVTTACSVCTASIVIPVLPAGPASKEITAFK